MAATVQIHEMSAITTGVDKTSGTVRIKAAATTGAASNFKAYNRLVLGYRNTPSDNFSPVHLKKPW